MAESFGWLNPHLTLSVIWNGKRCIDFKASDRVWVKWRAAVGSAVWHCERAADYESGGREFESLRARQKPFKYQNNSHAGKGAMQNEIICMAFAWPSGA